MQTRTNQLNPTHARRPLSLVPQFLPKRIHVPIIHNNKIVQYYIAKFAFFSQLRGMLSEAPLYVNEGPAQPPDLALATSALSELNIADAIDHHHYFAGAYRRMTLFLRQLEELGFDLPSVRRILDFGCGSGKYIRLCRSLPYVELVGTDMNPVCIDWCKDNIRGVDFHVNNAEPPLDFLENDSIDLAFAYSVFTHIPLDIQQRWLEELRRALRPGGIFFCTMLGDRMMEKMLTAAQKNQLSAEGRLTLLPSDEQVSLSSKVTNQHDVFQTREEISRVFSDYFTVRRIVSASPQDLVILEKPIC